MCAFHSSETICCRHRAQIEFELNAGNKFNFTGGDGE